MTKTTKTIVVLAVFGVATAALAQAPVAAPTGQKTLAATVGVYAFPTKGQEAEQQSQDEAACYTWAVQNVGSDPFSLAKQNEQQLAQADATKQQAAAATQGAGAKGAVRGAAAGALIGEIANDDAGKGAAIGAATGIIAGRGRARRARAGAEAQADQQVAQTQQATAQQLDAFKKAFSACLEAKNYMVKF